MNEACEGVVDAAWHDCYWYNRGCEAWNGCEEYACENGSDGTTTNSVSFLDWLDCYKNTSGDAETCGDATGDYNSCYWAGSCEGVVDAAWHDCYFYNQGCEAYNGCSSYTCGEGQGGEISQRNFLEWLECRKNGSDCDRLDESGAYYGCYMNEVCDGIVDAAWHDCFWYNRGC